MNTVSVLTVMDKFMFLSYTTVAAAYALTFWMLRLQENTSSARNLLR